MLNIELFDVLTVANSLLQMSYLQDHYQIIIVK
jgi:hypothetical protein